MKLSWFDHYGKTLLSGLFALFVFVLPLYSGDKRIDGVETVMVAMAVGNALMVYVVPITPKLPWLKSFTNAVLAGLVVLQSVMGNGVDLNEMAMIIGAVLAALGVVIAPAASLAQGIRVALGSDKPLPV